ncbi:MAG: hypothetical protein ACPG8W_20490 [Candidatus Promineifilaceae bacterium]
MEELTFSSKRQRYFTNVFAVGFLLFSWFVCYLWVMGLTEGWGAPWDIAPVRPPAGHWQRSINDYFESGAGMYLPTVLFLGVSLISYATSLARARAISNVSLIFGVTNLMALMLFMLVTIPIQTFMLQTPDHLTPDQWQYWGDFTREWPLTLISLVIFVGLIVLQRRLTFRSAL